MSAVSAYSGYPERASRPSYGGHASDKYRSPRAGSMRGYARDVRPHSEQYRSGSYSTSNHRPSARRSGSDRFSDHHAGSYRSDGSASGGYRCYDLDSVRTASPTEARSSRAEHRPNPLRAPYFDQSARDLRAMQVEAPQRAVRFADRQARDISVVPGGRSRASEQPNHARGTIAFICVVMVVFALLCIVRVTLSAATVEMTMESQGLSTQIHQARSQSNDLAVRHSRLADPEIVRDKAEALGMVSPSVTETINLPKDVVVVDEETGSLSLSKGIARAAGL